MASLIDRLYFLPFSDAKLRAEIEKTLQFRSADVVRETLSENISHITQKSGALLAAQAIFIVVDTYGIDHSWPRAALVVSVTALVLSALILLLNLRTVYLDVPEGHEKPEDIERASLWAQGKLTTLRTARFNLALYLTILSVVLMGFGAIDAALGWA